MSIQNKAMLVTLHIKGWTGMKLDRDVSKHVDSEYESRDGGKYNKYLIAKDEIKAIRKLQSEARNYLYTNTLPWDNSGARLLPVTHYFEFIKEINKLKYSVKSAEDRFLNAYPHLKTQAMLRLGKMYKASDYPSVQEVRNKYHFEVVIDTIAESKDIRFSLSEGEIKKIKNNINSRIQSRVESAVTHLWKRIMEAVEHIVEKLGEKKSVFRNTLMTNLTDLIDLLPKLNITDDPGLVAVRKELEELVVDPDILRKNNEVRDEVLKKARKLMNSCSIEMN